MSSARSPGPRLNRQALVQERDCGSTTIPNTKKKRIEAKGWKVGTAKEFLGLSSEEEAYIEIKFKLAESLRNQRLRRQMTQSDLAKTLKSSQSRVAKMEAGEGSVSLDLLVRSLLALGASAKSLDRLISTRKSIPAA